MDYATFSDYQTATGNDLHSIVGVDPSLVNPAVGNLHIKNGRSPAVDAGVNLLSDQMGTIDIDGNPRIFHKTVDIGADELVDKIPPKLTVTVSPKFLWPANHKYVTVKAAVKVSDNLDPSPTLYLEVRGLERARQRYW